MLGQKLRLQTRRAKLLSAIAHRRCEPYSIYTDCFPVTAVFSDLNASWKG
jgi:hypothetical protein